jgi:hypothetical protein
LQVNVSSYVGFSAAGGVDGVERGILKRGREGDLGEESEVRRQGVLRMWRFRDEEGLRRRGRVVMALGLKSWRAMRLRRRKAA